MRWRDLMFGKNITLKIQGPGGSSLVRRVREKEFRRWEKEGWAWRVRKEIAAATMLDFFFRLSGDRPYRRLVEYHFLGKDTEALRDEAAAAAGCLPEHLQPGLPRYVKEADSRLGGDAAFWEGATCRDAFDAVLESAAESLPLKGVIDSPKDAFRRENHDLAFGLFQVPTLHFAYRAAVHPARRKIMGLRRGFFG